MSDEATAAAIAKLEADGAAAATVASFAGQLARLSAGELGMLPESELQPIDELPDAERLEVDSEAIADLLDQTVVIKLNGGLGTSMGLAGPKSLLEVKDGLSFLDITARQITALRAEHGGARLPLVLLNSFRTREPSLAALAGYGPLSAELDPDFLQGRVPKLVDDGSLAPVAWPADPELEWSPPGHGDIYPALVGSGMLAAMLAAGYRYAFVSNADNLGAVLDPAILCWIAAEEAPFVMEVADRTAADRKGGHLARRADLSLVLREIAQTPEADRGAFADTERHRFFNTNSIWLDLQALAAEIGDDGVIDLPMIVNRKTVDPSDAGSTPVVQLESAIGAAIAAIPGARAIRVPRSRFLPVKTSDDLLVLRSDAYELTADGALRLAPACAGRAPLAELDGDYFGLIDDFEARFAQGAPSLVAAERLTVKGDVSFGSAVKISGAVTVEAAAGKPLRIDDGAVLGG
ncbi:MAG: UTP--glucose-1-phosphate uridylyltransferase [Solirubrobacteraceae bacterium]|nr:UTP--glucose-1-phosphate uridylyltransferase [Solirubrobacteraceae bacterium]